MVWRTMTLTMSHAPASASAASESARLRESPKTTVKSPKPDTHHSMATPARRVKGRWATTMAMATAPTPGALRRIPSPAAPTFRISRAYTGSSATAPPSSTANRSSEMAPSISWLRQM